MKAIMRGVIFDMDGVLVDSMKYHIKSWKQAFEQFQLKTSEQELALYEGMQYMETISLISQNNGVVLPEKSKEQIYREKKRILSETYEIEMYDNIIEILEYLKKKQMKLAVVTGSNKEFAHNIIEHNFKDIFDVIITSSDTTQGKPHPEPFQKAISELNLNLDEVLVVENAPLGVESAKQAGVRVIALETTLEKKYLKKANVVLKNHTMLFEYLQKNIS